MTRTCVQDAHSPRVKNLNSRCVATVLDYCSSHYDELTFESALLLASQSEDDAVQRATNQLIAKLNESELEYISTTKGAICRTDRLHSIRPLFIGRFVRLSAPLAHAS